MNILGAWVVRKIGAVVALKVTEANVGGFVRTVAGANVGGGFVLKVAGANVGGGLVLNVTGNLVVVGAVV